MNSKTNKRGSSVNTRSSTSATTKRGTSVENNEITGKWIAKATIASNGHGRSGSRRYVHNRGVKNINDSVMQTEIIDALRAGFEVRLLGGSIRLFHIHDKATGKMLISATCLKNTPIRLCCEDIGIKFYDKDGEMSESDVENRTEALNARAESVRLNVTPDTIVTCPNCGTEFRVGKVLK